MRRLLFLLLTLQETKQNFVTLLLLHTSKGYSFYFFIMFRELLHLDFHVVLLVKECWCYSKGRSRMRQNNSLKLSKKKSFFFKYTRTCIYNNKLQCNAKTSVYSVGIEMNAPRTMTRELLEIHWSVNNREHMPGILNLVNLNGLQVFSLSADQFVPSQINVLLIYRQLFCVATTEEKEQNLQFKEKVLYLYFPFV